MFKEDVFPIFPLNKVIFFPETNLPLNIFEEKYIEMIDFALSKNKKIGMIQSKENGDLYEVGCVGKINTYEETPDGRYLINLIGENYFSIQSEQKTQQKFRIAETKLFYPYNLEKNKYEMEDSLKTSLIEKFIKITNSSSQKIDVNFFKKIESKILIKFIAMSSPFLVAEKQMLLETYNLKDLSEKLITLLDYYVVYQDNNWTIN
mgnify:CR=1 FL=1|jgi:Lon protease-like protein